MRFARFVPCIASKEEEDHMTYRTHIRRPNTRIPIAILAAAAVAAGLSAAPGAAQAAGDKANSQEVTAEETVDDFVGWAQKQATVLDAKLDEAASNAKEAGANAADEVKEEWREARAAIDRQRDVLNQQIAELKKSAKGEWVDAKEATKEGLEALGDKIEEFRAMVTDKQKS
tara:strand:- start:61220 stop:61735 length:516 start_codon:yes stop_codon:yes gene_type:complete